MEQEKSYFWGLYKSKTKEPETRDAKVTWSDFFPLESPSRTGYSVTVDTASTLSAVYRAVNIWGDSLNVPVNHYRRTDGGKEPIYTSSAYRLLHNRPNKRMTPSMFWSSMEMARAFYGNAYAYIRRAQFGEPLELVWLHPDRVKPKYDPNDISSPLVYEIVDDMGRTVFRDIQSFDMIHVRTMSYDGMVGKAILEVARDSLGAALAGQDFAGTFFKNGSRNDGMLIHPGVLDDKSFKRLKKSFDNEVRRGGTLILESGMDYKPISIPPEQAQFLESRKFSIGDVARWFGIPEHMLANNDPTYSNIESQSLSFVTYNVRPRAKLYEQEFNLKLTDDFGEKEFFKFNLDALLRADLKTRYDSYAIAIQNEFMSPNEAREKENLNPRDGGDDFKNPNINPTNTNSDGEGEKV